MCKIVISVFLAVAIVSNVQAEDCGQEELARCAKPLQTVFSTTDLSFAPKREELDKLCPDLHRGLQCINSYTRRCMSFAQREQFNKIYKGTNEVIKDLCRQGEYQDEFLKHSACLQKVKPQHELCAIKYQQTMSSIVLQKPNLTNQHHHEHRHHHQQQELFEQQQVVHNNNNNNINENIHDENNDVKTVCCSFKEYLDCSEHVTRRVCGEETGTFIRGFLKKMSDTLIKNYCQDYYKGANQCPSQYSSATQITTSTTSFIILTTITTLLISLVR